MTDTPLISPEWCVLMARYNIWQNASIYGAADGLSAEARGADRGAFFGSIAGTLSHLLWGDLAWMARFDGGPPPRGGIEGSATVFADWNALRAVRTETDARILAWAEGLSAGRLGDDLTFYSGVLGREVSRPMAPCVAHFFNHQTHHRGQVHAMLTAAGARPGDTDLFLMPEDI